MYLVYSLCRMESSEICTMEEEVDEVRLSLVGRVAGRLRMCLDGRGDRLSLMGVVVVVAAVVVMLICSCSCAVAAAFTCSCFLFRRSLRTRSTSRNLSMPLSPPFPVVAFGVVVLLLVVVVVVGGGTNGSNFIIKCNNCACNLECVTNLSNARPELQVRMACSVAWRRGVDDFRLRSVISC